MRFYVRNSIIVYATVSVMQRAIIKIYYQPYHVIKINKCDWIIHHEYLMSMTFFSCDIPFTMLRGFKALFVVFVKHGVKCRKFGGA